MPKIKIYLSIILFALIISFFIYAANSHIGLKEIQIFIKNLGFYAPVIFLLIYTIAPVLFIPITPLSITSGVLFGPLWGSIFTLLGATFGASASFIVSRYLAKEWVDENSPAKVAIIQEKLEKYGWKFVVIARIMPLFPFNLQNYLFGVTNITFRTFFFATLLGMIPGSFVYTYLGYTGKTALNNGSDTFIHVAIAIALLLLLGMLPYMIKKVKKAFSR